jgi:hypothetical protein
MRLVEATPHSLIGEPLAAERPLATLRGAPARADEERWRSVSGY